MENKEIANLKKEFYTDSHLQKLIGEMFFPSDTYKIYRECSILNNNKIAHRGMTFSNMEYLKKTYFNQYYLFGNLHNDSNLYLGKARVMQFPRFPFKYHDRKKAMESFYKKKIFDYMVHYDIYLDWDINDKREIPEILAEVKRMINYLRPFKVKFEVVFSGTRGFKILIWNNQYNFSSVQKITNNIYGKLKFKHIDKTSLVCFPSKLMKCNFTLVHNKTNLKIAFPFKNFNYSDLFKYIDVYRDFECFTYKGKTGFREMIHSDTFLKEYDSFFLQEYNVNNLKEFVREFKLL